MAKKRSSPSSRSPAKVQPGARSSGVRRSPTSAAGAARSVARSTAIGPTFKGDVAPIADAATAKTAGTEAVARAFRFNATKPSEYGDVAGDGAKRRATHAMVGGSTLTEANASAKAGSGNRRAARHRTAPTAFD